MAAKRVGAIVLFDDGMLAANVEPLAKLALQHRLPSVGMVDFAAAGGLIYFTLAAGLRGNGSEQGRRRSRV